ncbi:MAG: DsbA family oxidoreductase [Bacteriovorax sp.]
MIKVEVWSDINCPYCYIGKRHLEAALKKFSGKNEVVLEWKSFELDPAFHPPKGLDNIDLLAKKYGRDRAWAKQMNDNMTKMARASGLDFHMDKVIPANSFNAHRLLHLAKISNVQNDLIEKLFSLKFVEGKDIDKQDVLREASVEMGLDPLEVQNVLTSDRFSEDVRRDEFQAESYGIRGVPHFIFNKGHSISGAQSVDVFLKRLEESSNFQVNQVLEF